MDDVPTNTRMSFSQRREVLISTAAAKHPEGKPEIVQKRTIRLEERQYNNQNALEQMLSRYPEAT